MALSFAKMEKLASSLDGVKAINSEEGVLQSLWEEVLDRFLFMFDIFLNQSKECQI